MKISVAIAALALCASANAAELSDIRPDDARALKTEAPAPVLQYEPAAKCGQVSGEITKLHLLAQTTKSQLFNFVDTQAEFREFVEMWTPILEKFGMKVTGTEYANELAVIKYESPDGRVVRDFMGEKLNYDALSPADIAKTQHQLLESLERAGMTPIASFTIKHEVFRPTFNIYFLTRPEETMEREVQLRQLNNGDDIDFDLLAGAVNIVRKDSDFSLVYIGRELGFKAKLAASEAEAAMKLADYKKFLSDNKKDFIAARTYKLDEPFVVVDHTYNYALNMYFFQ